MQRLPARRQGEQQHAPAAKGEPDQKAENCRGGENCCEVMDEKSLLIVATSASIARTSTVAERVEDLFGRALEGARRQEMLSWELRAATSLARLLHHQDRSTDAYCIIKTAQPTRGLCPVHRGI